MGRVGKQTETPEWAAQSCRSTSLKLNHFEQYSDEALEDLLNGIPRDKIAEAYKEDVALWSVFFIK